VHKKIVYCSFYFNLKIVRFFCQTLYSCPPEDEHGAARNMYRIQINMLYKELYVKLVTYRNYTKMHS
jgi:hypothetical protein